MQLDEGTFQMSIGASETGSGKPINQLVTVREVAHQLAMSERSVWRLVSAGKLVAPIKIGGATRWRQSDLMKWIAGLS